MKKVLNQKKGFTLVEMVLVIAIIVVLAAVALIGAGKYVNLAKSAGDKLGSHNTATESVAGDICAQAMGT